MGSKRSDRLVEPVPELFPLVQQQEPLLQEQQQVLCLPELRSHTVQETHSHFHCTRCHDNGDP